MKIAFCVFAGEDGVLALKFGVETFDPFTLTVVPPPVPEGITVHVTLSRPAKVACEPAARV